METPLVKLYKVAKRCTRFRVVLADANFPSASVCKHGPELIRADGK